MKKSDRERRTDASTCKMMPVGFTPGPYEVIIGRGRRCTMHWGNQRFRSMIDAELAGYTDAQDCKRQKSSIIGRVLADIQHHSPHAGFVKKDVGTGRWLSLTDAASRVTIAQAFRDALVDTYRSSKHSKQVKRRIEKKGGRPSKRAKRELPKEDTMTMELEASFQDSFTLVASTIADVEDEPSSSHSEMDLMGKDDFDALFDAFAGDVVNMEDNPFEPLPLATSMSIPMPTPLPPLPPRTQGSLKRNDVSSSSTPFGSTVPYRDVRAAMSA